jgi:hypothetical protein
MKAALTGAVAISLFAVDVLDETAASPSRTVRVEVFFPRGDVGVRCDRVYPPLRTVATPAVLNGAVEAVLRGPTAAERRRGYGGWFSGRTAGMLRRARVSQGVAHLDFRDLRRVIQNASSSCGSASLLAQLDRTATPFRDGAPRGLLDQRQPARVLRVAAAAAA